MKRLLAYNKNQFEAISSHYYKISAKLVETFFFINVFIFDG